MLGSLLHSCASAPSFYSPFDAVIQTALGGSLDASEKPAADISQLAKRMSVELERSMSKRSSSSSLLLTKSGQPHTEFMSCKKFCAFSCKHVPFSRLQISTTSQ